jgi:hypothetical protein
MRRFASKHFFHTFRTIPFRLSIVSAALWIQDRNAFEAPSGPVLTPTASIMPAQWQHPGLHGPKKTSASAESAIPGA